MAQGKIWSKPEAFCIARCDCVHTLSPLKWPNQSWPNFKDRLVAMHRIFGVKKIMKKFVYKEFLFLIFWIYKIVCPTVINWRWRETEAELYETGHCSRQAKQVWACCCRLPSAIVLAEIVNHDFFCDFLNATALRRLACQSFYLNWFISNCTESVDVGFS